MKDKKDHKLKPGVREVPQSICDQPGCKFKGKAAAQGVCFHALNDGVTKYIDDVFKRADDQLKEMKALRTKNKLKEPAKWAKHLENHLVCAWTNQEFGLDGLIHLRTENAKLKLALGKYDAKKKAKE